MKKKARDNQLAKAARRMKRRKQRREGYEHIQREIGLEALQQKMEAEGLLEDMPLMRNPPGKAKMSDILGRFVDPYVGVTENQQQYENMLGMAVLAWNMALLPEEQRQEMLENILKGVDQDPEYQAFFRDFVGKLIARKLKYFNEHKRRIIEFNVRDLGDQYHISVASSMD